ncbi:hypothetical protein APUTEX25_003126 [Auxenochlorella protothecoides]|uniref:PHD-type domain-containing protein n=1 Tax=Auxenochlorella protothecoides TaxID=3075 RepID=A0A3M7KW29_AUXPR|nr:hypothetical protein APUTEX25_003126 [Auxenochlorella protothecoides]|eukprot:RMZ54748.1 hypothetical protein APUTEX25_003126 [Auxenochlorella protothecoides]
MAGTRPPSLRAVILRSGQGVEEVIGGERQGLGALEELMHVSEGEIEIHVFKAPQLQDLPEYLAAKKPNMLYISGHPQPAAVELFLRALTGLNLFAALAVASVWMVALLKGLCQDKQYRGLMSVGVAAVSVTGVAAFEPTDAARWTAVLGSEDEEDEDVLAEGDGDDLDEDEEGDSGAGEDDDNGEGVELPPPLDPLPGQESADSEATQPSGDGQAGGVEVVPWRSQRGPLKTCTEAEFYADLSAFLKERKVRRRCAAGLCAVGTGLRGLAPGCNALHHAPASCGGASRTGLADVATIGRTSGFFPVLNALQLDLFNLYKEVCQRGGFALGNGINWKGQVFPAMRNFTQDHRLTGVGNALKRHYQVCLLDYEQANPADVTSGNCLVCGQGAGDDWISCDNCDRWLHFSCDKRPHPGSFKDYSKRHGLKFVCGPCTDGMESDAAQPSSAGKPSGPSGPNGTAQDHGATSSPQSHPGTNLASASRTGSTYLPSADVPQLGPQ